MSRSFHAIDPTTGKHLDPAFAVSSAAEVDAAVTAAVRAMDELVDPEERARFLEAIATELESDADAIVARAGLETALPEARLRGELGRTTGQLRLFAGVAREGSWVDARIDTADPDRQPLPRPDVRSMLVPIGPVAVFGASNFPLAFSVAGGDSASAWAAGNPVIVKAHPAHPGTSQLVAAAVDRAIASCGLGSGAFSILYDDGHEVGARLVTHPGVKAVGFTGSQAGGLALARLAAGRNEPIPVFAEMGSVNPVVVLPGALAASGDEIAAGLLGSCTLGVGQFCTNPGLAFVPAGDEGDRFVARLAEFAGATELPAMLTPGIARAYEAGTKRLVEAGARIVGEATGGLTVARVFQIAGEDFAHGDLSEEVFGPSTLVVRYASREQLLSMLDELEGQLTATIHSSDDDDDAVWQRLAQRAGRVLFGGYPTGVEVSHAMVHGGPWPATTNAATTSVGTRALRRFARLVAFQNAPARLLPPELRDDNPRQIWRLVDGEFGR